MQEGFLKVAAIEHLATDLTADEVQPILLLRTVVVVVSHP
jgi:hypothetical protein